MVHVASHIPSGNLVHGELEIVHFIDSEDLPILKMLMFHSYVKLPAGMVGYQCNDIGSISDCWTQTLLVQHLHLGAGYTTSILVSPTC